MIYLELLFGFCIFLLFYTYIGYGILLATIVLVKKVFKAEETKNKKFLEPLVTLLIAAYNEGSILEAKINNSRNLDYPKDNLKLLFITDGSDDNSAEVLKKYPDVQYLHQERREGKASALNRGMTYVKTPIVVFSDANSMVNPEAIREMVKHFENPKIGGVAGEKRIKKNSVDAASGSGEGFYWHYESILKRLDGEFYSVVGAAGELFSIRRDLYEPLEEDTLLDDFILSLRIAMNGHRIAYEPGAYSIESASISIKEELKRKIRICAGGFQAITRLKNLLNPFKFGRLSFQFISHRVLRWTLAPLSLLVVLPLNLILHFETQNIFYTYSLFGQILFYLLAFAGWLLENYKLRLKTFFIPYYFLMMNLSVYLGFFRYILNRQSVIWDRAERG